MEEITRSDGDGAKAGQAIVVIVTRSFLVLTVSLLSGCVIHSAQSAPPGPMAGQTRSVIYVPVLILPPSDDDEYDRGQSSDAGLIPPVQIVGDRQKMARPQSCQVMIRSQSQPPPARHAPNAAGAYKAKAKPDL